MLCSQPGLSVIEGWIQLYHGTLGSIVNHCFSELAMEVTMETLDQYGAVVIPDNEPGAQYVGWGQESISVWSKPLHSGPRVELFIKRDLQLKDLDLDATIAIIGESTRDLIGLNSAHRQKALERAGNICRKIYKHYANIINPTCDGLRAYYLSSTHSWNQNRT